MAAGAGRQGARARMQHRHLARPRRCPGDVAGAGAGRRASRCGDRRRRDALRACRRDRHAGDGGVRRLSGRHQRGRSPAGRSASRPAPTWCPLVEAGSLDGPAAAAAVDGYLDQLLAADPQIDTLLLGCTHYPLLRPLIERRAGPTVAVVDSAFTTALATEDLLDALGTRGPSRQAGESSDGHRIATTGDVAAFSTRGRARLR